MLASVSVFGVDRETAMREALELAAVLMDARKQEDRTDAADRAWEFVTGWIAGNKGRFDSPYDTAAERYGIIEKGEVCVICKELNSALEEAGFSYRKSIRGFVERG